MKKYLLVLITIFCAQNVYGSFGGSFRQFSRVGVRSMTTFSDFQEKNPKFVGFLAGAAVSLGAGFVANELHQQTLGRKYTESIFTMQQEMRDNQKNFQKDLNGLQQELHILKGMIAGQTVEAASYHRDIVERIACVENSLRVMDRTLLLGEMSKLASTTCIHSSPDKKE